MTTLYIIGIIGMLFLGLGHCALTFKTYRQFEANAFWFFSAGLGLLFSSFLNYIHFSINSALTLLVTVIANSLLTVFAMLLAYHVRKITMIMVALFSLILLVCSLIING